MSVLSTGREELREAFNFLIRDGRLAPEAVSNRKQPIAMV
jgi:hypothetical protein